MYHAGAEQQGSSGVWIGRSVESWNRVMFQEPVSAIEARLTPTCPPHHAVLSSSGAVWNCLSAGVLDCEKGDSAEAASPDRVTDLTGSLMAKDKGVVVSFRVDSHLANVLNKVPDKSSFIRDVILRCFYETCPLCLGRGILPEELSVWAARQLKDEKSVACVCCRYEYPRSALSSDVIPKKGGKKRFVCPHCQSHDHGH